MPTVSNNFRAQNPTKKGGRRPKEYEEYTHVQMSPEELEKRRKRRERNKEAAARCRQRRLETMETLASEVDRVKVENECQQQLINQLQSQKNELECLLRNHGCKIPDQLLSNTNNHHLSINQQHNNNNQFVNQTGLIPPQLRKRQQHFNNQQHGQAIALKQPKMEPTLAQVQVSNVIDSENLMKRPNLLHFGADSGCDEGSNQAGVPISTPSNGLTPTVDFNNLLLTQQTGLTPITTNSVFVTSISGSLSEVNATESILKTL